jgi:hypothetical protein
MAKINLNDFAKEITLKEGGKISLPIGQVKEVMKLVFEKLAGMDPEDVQKVLKRYQ